MNEQKESPHSRSFYSELIKEIDNSGDEEILNAFEDTTNKAIRAYITGVLEELVTPTNTEINKALMGVRLKAEALHHALEDLDHTGDGFKYLMELPLTPMHTYDANRTREDALTDEEAEAEAKERQKNPPEEPKNPSCQAIKHFLFQLALHAHAAMQRTSIEIETAGKAMNVNEEWYDYQNEYYKKQGVERKITNMHAMKQFIITFKPFWDQYINHPFTEGRNHPDSGQTISLAVDVIEKILMQISHGPLDRKIERSAIVTCIRNLRKEGKIEGVLTR